MNKEMKCSSCKMSKGMKKESDPKKKVKTAQVKKKEMK